VRNFKAVQKCGKKRELQGKRKITGGWCFTNVRGRDGREKEVGKRRRERVGASGFILEFLS
jgi:hypothetical protein